MNSSAHLRRIIVTLALLVGAAGVFAQTQTQTQTQTTKPFEPQVGQAGKDVVWVPTPQVLVDKMLDIAKLTPQDYLVDLGSGDGRTVITAAKRGARALGIEYNPDMVVLAQRNAAAERMTDKATFTQADLFESDFSKATVLTMFLLPSINMKLRPKILDMTPGTRVVSNTFTMEEWEPDERSTVSNCNQWCTALLWIVPAKVEGTWRMGQGQLSVTQKFQVVTGTYSSGGSATPITNGKLRGRDITFTAGTAQYSGRVNGDTMEGTIAGGSKWQATRASR